MSINNQGNFDKIHRIEPIDGKSNYDDQKGQKHKKVSYLGRMWEEAEEDLPLQPKALPNNQKRDLVYSDPIFLQKINNLCKSYTTLEDKIAGLFFYETEAYYNSEVQKEIEDLIQRLKIGGLLFVKGEYKRQQYLIERYQACAQMYLLIGSDFPLGLTYYFQGGTDFWGIEMMNVKYFSDLGRTIMSQNRNLGVHFQFAETRGKECWIHFPLSDDLLKAFRKGIRDAKGIISFFGHENKKFSSLSIDSPYTSSLLTNGEMREIYSLKTLTFLDMTTLSQEECQNRLLTAFQNSNYDAFLFSLSQIEMISFVTSCVKKGKIAEKDIERRLMKMLALNIKCQES